MKLYLDTEFTDFVEMDLISIALVPESGQAFYAERNDFDMNLCTDFVRKTVLPQLGKRPECRYPMAGLRTAIEKWLWQFEDLEPVICYDWSGDWGILFDLLSREVPPWLQCRNIAHKIDRHAFDYFMNTLFNGAAHHALHDATCNKLAYRSEK